jgi:hypothetical protein
MILSQFYGKLAPSAVYEFGKKEAIYHDTPAPNGNVVRKQRQ